MDLIDVTRYLTELFYKVYNEKTDLFKKEATAENAFKAYESIEKEKLAIIASNMDGTSQAARESQAMASPEWMEFQKELHKRRTVYINAKAETKGMIFCKEILQSLNKDRNFT